LAAEKAAALSPLIVAGLLFESLRARNPKLEKRPADAAARSREDLSRKDEMCICSKRTKCSWETMERLCRKGATMASVRVPADWSSLFRKHREVLNISLDPLGNETDITQIKKFRQCVFTMKRKNICRRSRREKSKEEKEMQERACAAKKL
jgi:hypothetical protein